MENHIDCLTIHQFRGLRGLSLESLGPVNLLVGTNNSGKTSILEALSVYSSPLDLRPWLNATWRREARDPHEPFFDAVEWMFPHEVGQNGDKLYEGSASIAASGKFALRGVEAFYQRTSRVADVQGTAEVPEQTGATIRLVAHFEDKGELRELTSEFQLWDRQPIALLQQSRSLTLPARTITSVSHRVEESQQLRLLTEATLEGEKSRLLALMREIDSEIRDMEILSPGGEYPRIYIEYGDAGLIPLSSLGDGVRRVLFIALVLPSTARGVLLIDELEASIHVSALGVTFAWLVRACRELDIQLFATTHSLEALDAMLESEGAELGQVVGYRLGRREGTAKAQRFAGQMLHRLRYDRGLDVRL